MEYASDARYPRAALESFATALLLNAGMGDDKASTTGSLLVEADAMGHTTHGLQLLPGYIQALSKGEIAKDGEPSILSDKPAAACWDGGYLPGLWLTSKAVDAACAKALSCGVGTIAVRRSGHIGCLAVFLQQAIDRKLMILLASSDPGCAYVAPFGGRDALMTPNPLGVGIPTDDTSILVDVSMSTTTVGLARRCAQLGEQFEEEWFIDSDGRPTNDPSVVGGPGSGSILPIGGLSHGHKGFGLSLMVEALTQGLTGQGRADTPDHEGASVYVQALDPEAFGGYPEFVRQTSWLAHACRTNTPRDNGNPVRMPGDRAIELSREAEKLGVRMHSGILRSLLTTAAHAGVEVPREISERLSLKAK